MQENQAAKRHLYHTDADAVKGRGVMSSMQSERQGWKEVSLQAAVVGWTVRHQECLCVPGLEH